MKKIIVISGGSDGLGKATAQLLAPNNQVIILSPDQTKLELVAGELACDFEVCDVTDSAQIQRTVDSIVQKYGRIDCLVNNAGIWIEGSLETNDPRMIHKVLEVNTLGTIWLTRFVLPVMKNQKAGRIINVISQAGLYAKADRSVYYASKWAITGFTKSLALELKSLGISVGGFYPGAMKTKLFEKVGVIKDLTNALPVEEAAQALALMVSAAEGIVFSEVGIQSLA